MRAVGKLCQKSELCHVFHPPEALYTVENALPKRRRCFDKCLSYFTQEDAGFKNKQCISAMEKPPTKCFQAQECTVELCHVCAEYARRKSLMCHVPRVVVRSHPVDAYYSYQLITSEMIYSGYLSFLLDYWLTKILYIWQSWLQTSSMMKHSGGPSK